MPQNLRTFLAEAAAADPGSVKIVDLPVDRKHGVQAYAAKAAQRGEYPAFLFTNVIGSRFPSVANVVATFERIALALKCSIPDVPRIYAERLREPIPTVTVDRSAAPVKDVVIVGDDVDVNALPISWHNELDHGPYITGGFSVTRDPQTGVQNVGIYRHEVFGPREVGALLGATHHGGLVLYGNESQDRRTPIAIAIGHHPAVLLAAVARLPHYGGELEVAGGMLGEAVTLVQAETSELLVPAEAEFIIEGYIAPHHEGAEGPFGEWPGHYLGDKVAPRMTITAITHRRDAIYQDVMSSAREHLLLGGLPRTGSIYRAVKDVVPNMTAVNCPPNTRMHCYIAIDRRRNLDVKRAALAALNTEPENLRAVIVVDDDINIFDDGDVLWAIGTRFDAERDLTILKDWNGPGGLLPSCWEYHADGSRTARTSSAIIIDATKPPPPVKYPPRSKSPDAAVEAVDLSQTRDLAPDEPLLHGARVPSGV